MTLEFGTSAYINAPFFEMTINLVNGKQEHIKAQGMTYDMAGNLNFYNVKKTIVTQQNGEGVEQELVKCYNQSHYVSYEPTKKLN